jgi:hypothetical protein
MQMFDELAAAANASSSTGGSPSKQNSILFPEYFFDAAFVDFYKSTYDGMQRTVVNPKTLKQIQQSKSSILFIIQALLSEFKHPYLIDAFS